MSQYMGSFHWRLLIMDEGHRLKGVDSLAKQKICDRKVMKVDHHVLLTGTPIQNNLQELWSLLNVVDYERFDSWDEFEKSFSMAMASEGGQGKDGDEEMGSASEELQAVLQPYILRRHKTDVMKKVPPKEEVVIEVEFTRLQKKIYRSIYEKNVLQLANNQVIKAMFVNVSMELRKCCAHPYLIQGTEEAQLSSQAADPNDLNTVMTYLVQMSGKMVFLEKLLPRLKEDGQKVLIFSQMTRMLDIIQDYLRWRGYMSERLDGNSSSTDRQAAIDRFNTPAGGVGINLTAASVVVIYDSDWNPQNDTQAQARCHRIGQTKTVKVYRLITRDSYEQHMFDTASRKLGLGTGRYHRREELNNLIKNGAYAAFSKNEEGDQEKSDQFVSATIDDILSSDRARTVTYLSRTLTFGVSWSGDDSLAQLMDEEAFDEGYGRKAIKSARQLERQRLGFWFSKSKRRDLHQMFRYGVYGQWEAFRDYLLEDETAHRMITLGRLQFPIYDRDSIVHSRGGQQVDAGEIDEFGMVITDESGEGRGTDMLRMAAERRRRPELIAEISPLRLKGLMIMWIGVLYRTIMTCAYGMVTRRRAAAEAKRAQEEEERQEAMLKESPDDGSPEGGDGSASSSPSPEGGRGLTPSKSPSVEDAPSPTEMDKQPAHHHHHSSNSHFQMLTAEDATGVYTHVKWIYDVELLNVILEEVKGDPQLKAMVMGKGRAMRRISEAMTDDEPADVRKAIVAELDADRSNPDTAKFDELFMWTAMPDVIGHVAETSVTAMWKYNKNRDLQDLVLGAKNAERELNQADALHGLYYQATMDLFNDDDEEEDEREAAGTADGDGHSICRLKRRNRRGGRGRVQWRVRGSGDIALLRPCQRSRLEHLPPLEGCEYADLGDPGKAAMPRKTTQTTGCRLWWTPRDDKELLRILPDQERPPYSDESTMGKYGFLQCPNVLFCLGRVRSLWQEWKNQQRALLWTADTDASQDMVKAFVDTVLSIGVPPAVLDPVLRKTGLRTTFAKFSINNGKEGGSQQPRGANDVKGEGGEGGVTMSVSWEAIIRWLESGSMIKQEDSTGSSSWGDAKPPRESLGITLKNASTPSVDHWLLMLRSKCVVTELQDKEFLTVYLDELSLDLPPRGEAATTTCRLRQQISSKRLMIKHHPSTAAAAATAEYITRDMFINAGFAFVSDDQRRPIRSYGSRYQLGGMEEHIDLYLGRSCTRTLKFRDEHSEGTEYSGGHLRAKQKRLMAEPTVEAIVVPPKPELRRQVVHKMEGVSHRGPSIKSQACSSISGDKRRHLLVESFTSEDKGPALKSAEDEDEEDESDKVRGHAIPHLYRVGLRRTRFDRGVYLSRPMPMAACLRKMPDVQWDADAAWGMMERLLMREAEGAEEVSAAPAPGNALQALAELPPLKPQDLLDFGYMMMHMTFDDLPHELNSEIPLLGDGHWWHAAMGSFASDATCTKAIFMLWWLANGPLLQEDKEGQQSPENPRDAFEARVKRLVGLAAELPSMGRRQPRGRYYAGGSPIHDSAIPVLFIIYGLPDAWRSKDTPSKGTSPSTKYCKTALCAEDTLKDVGGVKRDGRADDPNSLAFKVKMQLTDGVMPAFDARSGDITRLHLFRMYPPPAPPPQRSTQGWLINGDGSKKGRGKTRKHPHAAALSSASSSTVAADATAATPTVVPFVADSRGPRDPPREHHRRRLEDVPYVASSIHTCGQAAARQCNSCTWEEG
ncbi:choline dehydrogenase 7, partial [Perkinsus olseni]